MTNSESAAPPSRVGRMTVAAGLHLDIRPSGKLVSHKLSRSHIRTMWCCHGAILPCLYHSSSRLQREHVLAALQKEISRLIHIYTSD